jgi:hypothetical protein
LLGKQGLEEEAFRTDWARETYAYATPLFFGCRWLDKLLERSHSFKIGVCITY